LGREEEINYKAKGLLKGGTAARKEKKYFTGDHFAVEKIRFERCEYTREGGVCSGMGKIRTSTSSSGFC